MAVPSKKNFKRNKTVTGTYTALPFNLDEEINNCVNVKMQAPEPDLPWWGNMLIMCLVIGATFSFAQWIVMVANGVHNGVVSVRDSSYKAAHSHDISGYALQISDGRCRFAHANTISIDKDGHVSEDSALKAGEYLAGSFRSESFGGTFDENNIICK